MVFMPVLCATQVPVTGSSTASCLQVAVKHWWGFKGKFTKTLTINEREGNIKIRLEWSKKIHSLHITCIFCTRVESWYIFILQNKTNPQHQQANKISKKTTTRPPQNNSPFQKNLNNQGLLHPFLVSSFCCIIFASRNSCRLIHHPWKYFIV